jgi:hypothetical protein
MRLGAIRSAPPAQHDGAPVTRPHPPPAPARAQVKARHLWGDTVYTDDSDLVSVLMHMGYFCNTITHPPPQMSEVHAVLELLPPRDSYPSNFRNSVRSRAWCAKLTTCSYQVRGSRRSRRGRRRRRCCSRRIRLPLRCRWRSKPPGASCAPRAPALGLGTSVLMPRFAHPPSPPRAAQVGSCWIVTRTGAKIELQANASDHAIVNPTFCPSSSDRQMNTRSSAGAGARHKTVQEVRSRGVGGWLAWLRA